MEQPRYTIVNLDPVQAGIIEQWAAHMALCPQCCRWRTTSPRAKVCVRGTYMAGRAGEIFRDMGIGAIPQGRTGTGVAG